MRFVSRCSRLHRQSAQGTDLKARYMTKSYAFCVRRDSDSQSGSADSASDRRVGSQRMSRAFKGFKKYFLESLILAQD